MPYPAAPSRRMAWDEDGTLFGQVASPFGQWIDRTANKAELNDEDEVLVDIRPLESTLGYGVWIFPELREFDGIFLAYNQFSADAYSEVSTSADTTTGQDGTWTVRDANPTDYTTVMNNYRTGITSHAVANVRGVRYLGEHTTTGADRERKAIHLYGEISPGETPDRLLFMDELTGLEFAVAEDYGDVPRGSARDFEWRLKNNSTVVGNNKTLNNIQFTAEDLYLGSGNWYTFSVGGDAFVATKQITSLSPEASSSLLVCRQIIPATAGLGLHAARIQATIASLT